MNFFLGKGAGAEADDNNAQNSGADEALKHLSNDEVNICTNKLILYTV